MGDRHVGEPGELGPCSGATWTGSGGSPTARIFVTGCWIALEQVRDELRAGTHERRVVVGARVVGPEDEPLEVVDVRVEAVLAGPVEDLAGQRRPAAACGAAACPSRGRIRARGSPG